jgi:hypothetical protein
LAQTEQAGTQVIIEGGNIDLECTIGHMVSERAQEVRQLRQGRRGSVFRVGDDRDKHIGEHSKDPPLIGKT